MQTKITKLNDFQKASVKWAMNKKRSLIVALPGAGKSIMLMSYFLMLKKHNLANKMIIFTKNKAMVAFDKANIAHLSINKISSTKDFLQLYNQNFLSDVYVVSTTLLTKLKTCPNQVRKGFFTLISQCGVLAVDELHDYRNYKSTVSQALKVVTDYYQRYVDADDSHRICTLTATPCYKSIENWYAMMSYIEPRLFGSWFNFLDTYCITNQRNAYVGQKMYSANGTHRVKKSIAFTEIVGYKNVEQLYQYLEPYIFMWSESDFNFSYQLHYYELDSQEQESYNTAIKGLGLDKEFSIVIKDSSGVQRHLYRDKNDLVLNLAHKEVLVSTLRVGDFILFNGAKNLVEGVFDRKKDATHSVRLIKAQQVVSTAKEKLEGLRKLLAKTEHGALVYFQYKDTVQTVYQYLSEHPIGRRIVVLTGETSNLNAVVNSLSPTDIVLGTKVIMQSLDFYFDTLVLFQSLTNPGSSEQLWGRLARSNSPYRDIKVHVFMRPKSIEEYFYNRLRLLLKTAKTSVYSGNIPMSVSCKSVDERIVDVPWLKEHFLWNKQ